MVKIIPWSILKHFLCSILVSIVWKVNFQLNLNIRIDVKVNPICQFDSSSWDSDSDAGRYASPLGDALCYISIHSAIASFIQPSHIRRNSQLMAMPCILWGRQISIGMSNDGTTIQWPRVQVPTVVEGETDEGEAARATLPIYRGRLV